LVKTASLDTTSNNGINSKLWRSYFAPESTRKKGWGRLPSTPVNKFSKTKMQPTRPDSKL